MQLCKKEIKVTQIGNNELKLSLLTDDSTVYVEHRKKKEIPPLTRQKKAITLQEPISNYTKFAVCKVHIQKSIIFLYASSE